MKPAGFFNYMEYIYAVYQEGSFTRAAEKLYISQPALSLTIKKVENEIGHPIFERAGKEIKPTAIGAKYISAIESTMRIQNNLNAEIDDILMLKNGTISIGAPPFIAENILPEVLMRFKSKYPDIDIRIFAECDASLEERLDNNEVDIVINNAAVFLENCKYLPLEDERIFIVTSKQTAKNHGIENKSLSVDRLRCENSETGDLPKISILELQNERFILLKKGAKLRQMAKQIFDEKKLIPNISMEFDYESTAVKYTAVGFGVSFLSEKEVKYGDLKDNLCLFLPETDYSSFTMYVIRRKSRYTSDTVKEFTEYLRSYLKE